MLTRPGMADLCAAHNPFTHLVIVCGHGTYRGHGDPRDESSWILESFRKSNKETGKPGEHLTFVQHILSGVEILKYDSTALLVFSGGRTQQEIQATEAESYRAACQQLDKTVDEHRLATEVLATDSYQNLLFSVLAFRRVAGLYPRTITVITHAFKSVRFLKWHGPAIRWPAADLRTVGIDPAFTLAELEQVQRGEYNNAVKHFMSDPYGVRSPLKDKKEARNWDASLFEQLLQAEHIDAGVRSLLTWRGGPHGHDLYDGPLPWAT